MNTRTLRRCLAVALITIGAAHAHCDSLDGPVVRDAQVALERGDVTPVLKWARAQDEDAIGKAFRRTLAARGASPEAQALVDRFFFETLVRIHRAGEGETFTGLKPAGSVDPGIAAADAALADGHGEALAQRVAAEVREGIERRYATVTARKAHADESIAAGRAYVEAYVEYVHFVEQAERLAAHGAAAPHHAPAPVAE